MSDSATASGYETCIVTFFDILGFRATLDQRSALEIADLLQKFRFVSRADEPPIKDDTEDLREFSAVHAEIISDAIVRSRTVETTYQDGALFQEIIDLLHIQTDLISEGIIVRGGTTIGSMHLGRDFQGPVFGPALVEAYEFEAQEVIFPRIAIHDRLLQEHRDNQMLWREGHDYEGEKEHLDKLLCHDESGLAYIDYIGASMTEMDDGFDDWLYLLDRHKDLISNGLSQSRSTKVRRKYLWLKNYHNRKIMSTLSNMSQSTEEYDRLSDMIID